MKKNKKLGEFKLTEQTTEEGFEGPKQFCFTLTRSANHQW